MRIIFSTKDPKDTKIIKYEKDIDIPKENANNSFLYFLFNKMISFIYDKIDPKNTSASVKHLDVSKELISTFSLIQKLHSNANTVYTTFSKYINHTLNSYKGDNHTYSIEVIFVT
jgi:hypothetical protein